MRNDREISVSKKINFFKINLLLQMSVFRCTTYSMYNAICCAQKGCVYPSFYLDNKIVIEVNSGFHRSLGSLQGHAECAILHGCHSLKDE